MICPCGLTRKELVALPALLGDGAVCLAFKIGSRNEFCGELLANHPVDESAGQPTLGQTEVVFSVETMREIVREEYDERERKRLSYAPHTHTRSERVREMKANKQYVYSRAFDRELKRLQVQWWPSSGKWPYPTDNKSQETEPCQQFVSQMLELFKTGTATVIDKEKPKKQVVVHSIPNPFAFKQRTAGTWSPDVTFHNVVDERGETSITIFLEVKDSGDGAFDPAHHGKVVHGLSRILHLQPYRDMAIGVLTDGRRFLFLRCTRCVRDPSEYQHNFEESAHFEGQQGWQILFGLMTVHPDELGFQAFVVPGFIVQGILGVGADAQVFKAKWDTTSTAADQAVKGPVRLPDRFVRHLVAGDGNCFFHAIAHQLQLTQAAHHTHAELRAMVIERVDEDSDLRELLDEDEYADLLLLGGWVDHVAVAAMAQALHMNIEVYGGPRRGSSPIVAGADEGAVVDGGLTLRIVYNGCDHYDSVVPVVEPVQPAATGRKSRKRTADTPPEQPQPTKKQQQKEGEAAVTLQIGQANSEQRLPVVVKLYHEEDWELRNHEYRMLDRLKWTNHVPRVIRILEVLDRPAMILSPAGEKVLPIKDGVRATPADFVMLLNVLRDAHAVGICHRDVKPANIFKDAKGRILLGDWGSAADTGIRRPWAGSEFFYEAHEYDHVPDPADDLVALVRTVYMMNHNNWVKEDVGKRLERHPHWRQALKDARDCDYAALSKFFRSVW